MILDYHMIALGAVTIMAIVVGINIVAFRSLRVDEALGHAPFVSVLIPARNEADKIGACLSGLANQDYPRYEVLILDDGSNDGTEAIARQWSLSRPEFQVFTGQPLPSGWVGKAFACHQLASRAQGELLLFVDADTLHHRQSIRSSVAAMEATGAGLLSVIPHQVMSTFWERLILPLLHFNTFCYLPFPLVWGTRNPKLAMANGQCMLFRRQAYEAVGGHASVRSALVEDVWLARRVKSHGFTLRVMDGAKLVSCRMYSSLREIWDGFSKNLFAGFQYSLPLMVAVILFNMLTSVAPFVELGLQLSGVTLGSRVTTLALIQIAVIVGIRIALALRFQMRLPHTLLHPLAILVFIGIAVNSCRWVLIGGGSRWKGRRYDFRKHIIVN